MMKRCLALLLLVVLTALSGCAKQTNQIKTTASSTEESLSDISTTLMVYMIGSDLEAKTAAGTQDLEEIASSGTDISNTNVLVYAGGSPYWHNEVVEKDCNTILELTETGFSAVHSEPAVSMGEPETLTGFLEYCYENHPAEQYALILWNHGSGPVRGYGQDLVFNGGSLLLSEMEQALEDSPFGPENPLLFVGFDACLMASAELACVFDDYARYMVASQEVEPSIGWNYQFVKDIGDPDAVAMLQSLTDDYLSSCEIYYQEKNYDYRETTLSCVDLSMAAELEKAIDELFDRAADDAKLRYDQLSALRVQTRAYGRASTGSEYDLVDLGDLTEQMAELYPSETAQIQNILKQMVISNSNNTQICSGLSLYYPFYNKDYFFKSIRGADSWQTTYQNLGLFPSYQHYLEEYQQIWKNTDRLDEFAQSTLPSKEKGIYSLALTDEQQSCFASAKYYILQRKSAELYACIFVSSDVTNQDGQLIANFDGNVIYVHDKYGNYHLPAVEEKDQIGDLGHYAVVVGLSNQIPDTGLRLVYLGGEQQAGQYRYHLILDKSSKSVSVSALLPYDTEADLLTGGKLEDADTSQWVSALFLDQKHRYLTRDENGLIMPLDQWHENSWFTGMQLNFTDEIEFVYEPLDGGEYYLMMEVQDTQGSRYCSELLPITVPDQEPPPVYQYPETDIRWDSGDRVLLAEEHDVAVYLKMVEDQGKMRFTLELENNGDCAANLVANDLVCNQSIYCDSYFGSIHAEPGQSALFDYITNLRNPEVCGALTELSEISFQLFVRDEKTGALLIEPQVFNVALSEQMTEDFRTRCERTVFDQTPYLGALAKEQVLLRNEDMVITLLGLGTNDSSYLPIFSGFVKVENLTDQPMTMSLDGAMVNGQYIKNNTNTVDIPAHLSVYLTLFENNQLKTAQIDQIQEMSLLLREIRNQYVFTGFSDPIWCPVELAQKGTESQRFQEAEQVIFDKNGIRVALNPPHDLYGGTYWDLTIYNGSTHSIKADVVHVTINGAPASTGSVLGAQAGPGQYGRGELFCNIPLEEIREISFSIQILDIFEERVIFTDEEVVTLQLDANG